MSHARLGRLDEGLQWVVISMSRARALGDRTVEVRALNVYGAIALERGGIEEATEFFRRARTEAMRCGELSTVGRTSNNLGIIAGSLGKFEQAQHQLQEALALYQDIGNLSEMNLKLADEYPKAQGHIVGIHIKDTTEGEVRRIPFDEGTVNFVEDLQVILKSGFTGPLLIEMWADENEDTFEEVRDARLFVIDKIQTAQAQLE